MDFALSFAEKNICNIFSISETEICIEVVFGRQKKLFLEQIKQFNAINIKTTKLIN